MSDFYAAFFQQFDGKSHSFLIADRLSGERISVALGHYQCDEESQSPPFPTWTIDEQVIRQWANTLNNFVRYIDDRKVLKNE